MEGSGVVERGRKGDFLFRSSYPSLLDYMLLIVAVLQKICNVVT